MAFDYAKTGKSIVDKIGGAQNITSATHCMTRLRFTLKDKNIPKDQEVEAIPGVIRVIKQGGQYQVVIGNEVSHVYNEVSKLGNFTDSVEGGQESEEKENLFSRLCGFISGCMTPLLPAMLGCGMIKVVLTILLTFKVIDASGSTYEIINAAGDAFFYFMPILLANSTAKKVGTSPTLAMVVAALLLHPNIGAVISTGDATLFGIPVAAASYASSVLPVLLMVPLMKYIEKFADKVSPNLVKVFLKPLIVLIISIPIALIVVGPIGVIVGEYLSSGVNFLYNKAGWLTIMLISAAMPFIIMTGMHYALVPISVLSLTTLGFDPLLVTTMFCSNLSQGASSMAVAVRSKNTDIKSTAAASGISAIVAGVTEPAMYGITLKYKTPMIGAVIGAATAGLYAGITHLVSYTMGGSPSVMSLIQMIGGGSYSNLINGIITMAIALGVSFVATMILYKEKSQVVNEEVKEVKVENISQESKKLVERIEILSPVTGTVKALSEVNDPVFAGGALGEGVAVVPAEGKVYAPADGTVTVLMDSKHAIGFVTDTGVEVLIHVGIDTVNLNGKYFDAKCSMGDKVKAGDLLLEFDIDAIKSEAYDVITPIIISNTANFVSIKPATLDETIHRGETILTIV